MNQFCHYYLFTGRTFTLEKTSLAGSGGFQSSSVNSTYFHNGKIFRNASREFVSQDMFPCSCRIICENIKNCSSYVAKCKDEVFFTHPLLELVLNRDNINNLII